MKFCLLVDDKPLFCADTIKELEHYIDVLYDSRKDGKRPSERDYAIITGFDEKNPQDRSHWENVYKTCNRCNKILSVEHFITERGKEVGSCDVCRAKRKVCSKKRPLVAKETIGQVLSKRFGYKDTDEIRKKLCFGSECGGSNYIRSPKNEEKHAVNLKLRSCDTIVIPKIEVPQIKEHAPLFYEPFKKNETKVADGVKRWSFYYLYPYSQPKITSTSFPMSDYPAGVKKVGKDGEWVNFSLVCYSKNEKEAKEMVEKFMKRHKIQLKKAERDLDSKIPQWEFYK